MALLNSGFLIENPSDFTSPLYRLLKLGFGLKKDAEVEEIEVDITSIEEENNAGEKEEPDVEGEVEVEDTGSNQGAETRNEEL